MTVAWISSITYIIGRLPQIYHNYKKKSVHGLSILMYIFSICGNLFYIASVLSESLEIDYIIKNLSWIFFTIFSGILDIIVIIQYRIYKKNINPVEIISI
jgi:uncharacterized protein with PQ loop repeat